jgi:hypothetical protein
MEAKRIENAQLADRYVPGIAKSAQTDVQNRIINDQFRNQMGAQLEHDQNYAIATDPATNAADRARALAKVNALIPRTGDKYENGINTRTYQARLGDWSQILPPAVQQAATQKALTEANEPKVFGVGNPQPTGQHLFGSDTAYAQRVTGLPVQGAPSQAPAQSVTPTRPVNASVPPNTRTAAPQTQTLPVNLDALPKVPPIPPVTDQISKAAALKRVDSDNEQRVKYLEPLKEQSDQAARNTAIYSQLLKKLANADPKEVGPTSSTYKAAQNLVTYLKGGNAPNGLVNLDELDKYLAQLGVGGSKQLLGSDQTIRQQELLMLMAHGNPNIDQPLQVIKNLAAYGEAGNKYDMLAANTAMQAIQNAHADPVQAGAAIENQLHRRDFISHQLSLEKRPYKGQTYVYDPTKGPRNDPKSWELEK